MNTLTRTPSAWVTFPAASRAVADNVCVPFDVPEVFHDIEYGGAVLTAPSAAPSNWN